MCVVCGCTPHDAHHHTDPEATSPMAASGAQADHLHFGQNPARQTVAGLTLHRTIAIEADVLGANSKMADRNREAFAAHGVCAINLLSSPGSGKTTLLCETLFELKKKWPELNLGVIEGDQETQFDAQRIRATGVSAIQVNTGKGCHLDALMVSKAFTALHHEFHSHAHEHAHEHGQAHGQAHGHAQGHSHDLNPGLLFIENVGNLVCPALWDLGEAAKVVVLSVTEGEDKPLKYPDMFAAADLMILNKIDLLPHLRFDVNRCLSMAKAVNPRLEILQLSATSGEGMADWLTWLSQRMASHSTSNGHAQLHPHSDSHSLAHKHDHGHEH